MFTVKWKWSRTHRHKLYLTVIPSHCLFSVCELFPFHLQSWCSCCLPGWAVLEVFGISSKPSAVQVCALNVCVRVSVRVCVCAYTQDGMCAWLHTQKHSNCPVLGDVWAWASASCEPALHLWMEGDICERWRWRGVLWGLRNKIVRGSTRDMHIWRTSSVTVAVTGTILHTKSRLACSNKPHGLKPQRSSFWLDSYNVLWLTSHS